ncbi:MAG: glycoside hydrolase family 3 N-terminal domain-containing protein, partial [Chloroflexota bacterium]
MKKIWALLPVFILIGIMGSVFIPVVAAQDRSSVSSTQLAQAFLDDLTPEERVGQLFLVTFEGSQLSSESEITDLIINYHIGGVVLQSKNDNFSDVAEDISQVALLNNSLQELAVLGRSSRIESEFEADEVTESTNTEVDTPTDISRGIPILIGTTHGGGENSEILFALTQSPSQLSVGATWQPDAAKTVGFVLGDELKEVGFNLLLNPSLNLASRPEVGGRSESLDLLESFGSNPYWAGRFARKYVEGVQEGSNGRIAVIGSHFPGAGGSDRPLNSEISTVLTTLQEMQEGSLLPFMLAADSEMMTETIDGFMTAHLRYQGFQGNIDSRSNPISFDGQALETLFQIEPLAGWLSSGGLLVSGELGAEAIQQFYETADDLFPHRRVAKDALLAGNDLLYVANFAADENDEADKAENIRDAIEWFTTQYSADPTFRARVDEAALKVIQTKLELYDGDLSLGNILVDEVSSSQNVGLFTEEMRAIARDAATQLSPRPEENPEPLQGPPNTDNTIVVFTDSRPKQQCSSCDIQFMPDPDGLEERILSLYGPDASNQVNPARIFSFSFEELEAYLDSDLPILVEVSDQ